MLVLLSAILQNDGVCIPSHSLIDMICSSVLHNPEVVFQPIPSQVQVSSHYIEHRSNLQQPHPWFSYCIVRMIFLALFKCFHKAESIRLCRLWCHSYLADNNPREKYSIKSSNIECVWKLCCFIVCNISFNKWSWHKYSGIAMPKSLLKI